MTTLDLSVLTRRLMQLLSPCPSVSGRLVACGHIFSRFLKACLMLQAEMRTQSYFCGGGDELC